MMYWKDSKNIIEKNNEKTKVIGVNVATIKMVRPRHICLSN
jgi:hypothetical protein